jgi:hypothetical protein
MMRRMQYKEVERKLESEKAAIKFMADSESKGPSAQIDEAELERIRKRQAGTMVTVESFMSWKAAFDAEQAAKSTTTNTVDSNAGKITGKQWFLSQQGQVSEEAEDALLAALEEEAGDEDDEEYIPSDEDEEYDDEVEESEEYEER